MKQTLLSLALWVSASILLTSCSPQADQVRTIELSGSGEVLAKADQITGTLSLQTNGKVAGEERETLNRSANQILEILGQAGIPKENIQQSGLYQYRLSPTEIVSQNSIRFKLDGLDAYPALMDRLGEVPHVYVQNPEKNSSQEARHTAEARKLALQNARLSAESMAQVYHLKVGKVIRIVDGGSPQPHPRMALRSMASSGGTPAMDQGLLTFQASVQVVFELE